MWNRVFLLASGFLFGWALVSYWSVPRARVRTQTLRVGLGLLWGAIVIVLLARSSPQAALAGVIVWALSALVAYAGNARQVGREEAPFLAPLPSPTGLDVGREAIVLVSDLEPPRYDGPAYWAWRFRRREAAGGLVPHWLARPRVYARIRAAYATVGAGEADGSPSGPLERLGDRLRTAFGAGCRVETVRIVASPSVVGVLAALAKDGIPRIVIQPLSLLPDALDALRAAVTQSRVREVGVRVEVLDVLPVPAWDDDEGRLDLWSTGRAPAPLPDPDAAVLAQLQSRVAALEC